MDMQQWEALLLAHHLPTGNGSGPEIFNPPTCEGAGETGGHMRFLTLLEGEGEKSPLDRQCDEGVWYCSQTKAGLHSLYKHIYKKTARYSYGKYTSDGKLHVVLLQ